MVLNELYSNSAAVGDYITLYLKKQTTIGFTWCYCNDEKKCTVTSVCSNYLSTQYTLNIYIQIKTRLKVNIYWILITKRPVVNI